MQSPYPAGSTQVFIPWCACSLVAGGGAFSNFELSGCVVSRAIHVIWHRYLGVCGGVVVGGARTVNREL